MTDKQKYSPPEKEAPDHIFTFVRAMVSAIPVIGGPGVELISSLLSAPIEKRKLQWMGDIAEAIRDLEQNSSINLKLLKNNDVFIDTVLNATQIALRNHQEEKRRALIKTIKNSAFPDPDRTFIQSALNFIDSLTPWHIRVLKFLSSPKRWEKDQNRKIGRILGMDLYDLLDQAFPELRDHRDIEIQVVGDLFFRELINIHPTLSPGAKGLDMYDHLMREHATTTGLRLLAILS